MSKLIENCNEMANRSHFEIRETRFGCQLEISNACLLFTNFAGAANKFGNTSKNFNVVVTEEFANHLMNGSLNGLNVNVHSYGKGTEEEPKIFYINVKVNMNVQYPPEVTLYVKNSNGSALKRPLDDATIGCLDRIDMERADVIINVKESKAREGWAVFYTNTLKVVQNKMSSFDGYYDEFDDPLIEPNPELLEANSSLFDND